MTTPNLLFMMTDHQRADSLHSVQAGQEVCPNINRLSRDGVRFSRAYNTCPLCVPARTALATGKYPTSNGVITNDWEGATAGNHVTLHELLYRAGYEVAHIGITHIRVQPSLETRFTFAVWEDNGTYADYLGSLDGGFPYPKKSGFQSIVQENHNGALVECAYSNTRTAVWPGPAATFKDLYWCRKAVEFLQRDRTRPFALFLYLWAPHPPLIVPEPYASLFAPDAINLPANVGCPSPGEPSGFRAGVPAQLAVGQDIDAWRRVWAAHLGLVRLADDGIGQVLDALSATGHDGNTLRVFTADHGDHLGQHGMYQKMEMYEQAINVPLLVSGPGIAARTVESPVSHLDIMPTVLELAGLDVPGDLDGISMAPALTGRTDPPVRPVFSIYAGNPVPGDTRRCVVDGNWKYVWSPPDGEELYDLAADPLEMHNLINEPQHRTAARRLRALSEDWAEQHGDAVFRQYAST